MKKELTLQEAAKKRVTRADDSARVLLTEENQFQMPPEPVKHPKGYYYTPGKPGSFTQTAEKLALQVELLEARANQRWVSVDDRRPALPRGPEHGVQVLVWPHVNGSAVAFYGRRVTREPNFYLYGAVADVTHWMPLPEGPK